MENKPLRIKNQWTGKLSVIEIPSNEKRAQCYFDAAYTRIFLQGLRGCCKSLSYVSDDNLYHYVPLMRGTGKYYKKIYEKYYPEFCLFSKSWQRFWFDNRDERIIALLLCEQMAINP